MKRYKELFEGCSALITGGAKRIGRAVALELARMGCNVIIHYSSSYDEAVSTVEKVREYGVRSYALKADLSNSSEAEEVLYRAVDMLGPIDYLVNNASSYDEVDLENITLDDIQESMAVNTYAPLTIARAFSQQKIKSAMVNFLDTRIHCYDREHVAYHLSKRALYSITKMMAYEYSPNLRVNGVAPGIILPPVGQGVEWLEKYKHTNLLGSYGSVEDITDAVIFLLASAFITGEVICVDGGRHLKNNFYG